MRGTLFSELVVSRPGGARAARWAGPIPVSMVLHGGALAALVLVPIMTAELPSVPVVEPPLAFPTFPTPPPVVRLDPGTGGRPRLRPPGPPKIGRPLVMPVVVPATVTQDPQVTDEVPTSAVGHECVGCVLDPSATSGPHGNSAEGDDTGTHGEAVGPYRVGPTIKEPRKLRHVAPAYPPLAETVGLGATVTLECRIDTDGRVADIKVLRGHDLFDAAAVAAVRQWVYTPTLLNGQPVPILMTVTVRFISRR